MKPSGKRGIRRKKRGVRSVLVLLVLLAAGGALLIHFQDSAGPSRPYDPLVLVNGEHPCGKKGEPEGLVPIERADGGGLLSYEESGMLADENAVSALLKMLDAAREDGLTRFHLASAYRSYARQKSLFDEQTAKYIAKTGNTLPAARDYVRQTVALPGESEHQTGLAFDLNALDKNGSKIVFGNTPHFKWLKEHCWDFGFILRYPEDKKHVTGIDYEPWHYRYVGIEHARAMRDRGQCLEEYAAGFDRGKAA